MIWSGTLPAPNEARTDGPFATLIRARDALRALKSEGPLAAPATVWLRGGTYYQGETLVFGPRDGGTEAAPVTYAAYPGETPVVWSAIVRGTGWQLEPFDGDGWDAPREPF